MQYTDKIEINESQIDVMMLVTYVLRFLGGIGPCAFINYKPKDIGDGLQSVRIECMTKALCAPICSRVIIEFKMRRSSTLLEPETIQVTLSGIGPSQSVALSYARPYQSPMIECSDEAALDGVRRVILLGN